MDEKPFGVLAQLDGGRERMRDEKDERDVRGMREGVTREETRGRELELGNRDEKEA